MKMLLHDNTRYTYYTIIRHPSLRAKRADPRMVGIPLAGILGWGRGTSVLDDALSLDSSLVPLAGILGWAAGAYPD